MGSARLVARDDLAAFEGGHLTGMTGFAAGQEAWAAGRKLRMWPPRLLLRHG